VTRERVGHDAGPGRVTRARIPAHMPADTRRRLVPEHGAHALTDAVEDPDDGAQWLTLDDGRDVQLTTRKAWVHRRYTLAGWQRDAVAAYRDARDAGTRYGSPAHRFPRAPSPARPAPRSGAIS
jgi:hypothetical protein